MENVELNSKQAKIVDAIRGMTKDEIIDIIYVLLENAPAKSDVHKAFKAAAEYYFM